MKKKRRRTFLVLFNLLQRKTPHNELSKSKKMPLLII